MPSNKKFMFWLEWIVTLVITSVTVLLVWKHSSQGGRNG